MSRKNSALDRIVNFLLEHDQIKDVVTTAQQPVLQELGVDARIYSRQGSSDYRLSWSSYPAKKMFFRIQDEENDKDDIFYSQAHYLFKVFSCGTIMIFHQQQLRNYLKSKWGKFPTVQSRATKCHGVLVDVEELERHVETYSELPLSSYEASISNKKIALLPPRKARD